MSKWQPNGWKDALIASAQPTSDPGWAYCPVCNASNDDYSVPNCDSRTGVCRGRSVLPLPTTRHRPVS